MRTLSVMTRESFLLLCRDRIFVPALIAAAVIAVGANLVSDWGIEEFEKLLFDLGLAGFQLAGGMVALFWGIKSVSDARQDGSLESQLAWPVGKATWLVGRYLGLAAALGLLWLLALLFWQGVMLLNHFGMLRPNEVTAFVGLLVGWLVLGALGVLLSSVLRQSVALFAGVSLWIVGLVSAIIANTLAPGTPELSQRLVKGLARAWDLQQFNLLEHALKGHLTRPELATRGAYGILLILAMISVACVAFTRRDAAA